MVPHCCIPCLFVLTQSTWGHKLPRRWSVGVWVDSWPFLESLRCTADQAGHGSTARPAPLTLQRLPPARYTLHHQQFFWLKIPIHPGPLCVLSCPAGFRDGCEGQGDVGILVAGGLGLFRLAVVVASDKGGQGGERPATRHKICNALPCPPFYYNVNHLNSPKSALRWPQSINPFVFAEISKLQPCGHFFYLFGSCTIAQWGQIAQCSDVKTSCASKCSNQHHHHHHHHHQIYENIIQWYLRVFPLHVPNGLSWPYHLFQLC